MIFKLLCIVCFHKLQLFRQVYDGSGTPEMDKGKKPGSTIGWYFVICFEYGSAVLLTKWIIEVVAINKEYKPRIIA